MPDVLSDNKRPPGRQYIRGSVLSLLRDVTMGPWEILLYCSFILDHHILYSTYTVVSISSAVFCLCGVTSRWVHERYYSTIVSGYRYWEVQRAETLCLFPFSFYLSIAVCFRMHLVYMLAICLRAFAFCGLNLCTDLVTLSLQINNYILHSICFLISATV